MKNCLICESNVKPFISFGDMPISNAFVAPQDFGSEYYYELAVGFCPECTMVQLLKQPDREMMFHENYAYFSSISTRMASHFEEFAKLVMTRFLDTNDPFVIEIGSNDGIMLHHFSDADIKHLGVEPSANVAETARNKGVETICEFFDQDLARRIRDEKGTADAILAANVMCHIPYLHSLAAGVNDLLKPGGVLVFQDPYLGDIIEKTSYDQIYDEHVFFFSVSSVEYLFGQHGLEVVDIMHEDVHGGSMRYFIARRGERDVSQAVLDQKQTEKRLGLGHFSTYDLFRKNVEKSRDNLKRILSDLADQKKRVVGYGATSKSATVLNYCGIDKDLVEFISDTTPTKQGRFTPGSHIPVLDYSKFEENYPDVALLFAWNHGEEIIAKETAFRESGGQWLTYVPRVDLS